MTIERTATEWSRLRLDPAEHGEMSELETSTIKLVAANWDFVVELAGTSKPIDGFTTAAKARELGLVRGPQTMAFANMMKAAVWFAQGHVDH